MCSKNISEFVDSSLRCGMTGKIPLPSTWNKHPQQSQTWSLQMGRHNQHAPGTRHVQAIPMGEMGPWPVNKNSLGRDDNFSHGFLFRNPCRATIINASLFSFRGNYDSAPPKSTWLLTNNLSLWYTNGWNSSPSKCIGHPCNTNVRTLTKKGSRSFPQRRLETLSGEICKHSNSRTLVGEVVNGSRLRVSALAWTLLGQWQIL